MTGKCDVHARVSPHQDFVYTGESQTGYVLAAQPSAGGYQYLTGATFLTPTDYPVARCKTAGDLQHCPRRFSVIERKHRVSSRW
jgi:hypothetical protein